MISPSSTGTAEAATAYAAHGWPVIPLAARAKTPLTRHGLHDASDDPDVVESWWLRWPDANVGLRTGIAFDVLDLDGPDGTASLARIAPGYRHDGPVSITGKGYHLLFAPTGKRNFARREPGMDFRGDGGYIVAPPSIHPLGHAYRWGREPTLALPGPTDWLLELFPKPLERTTPKFDPARNVALGMLNLVTELEHLGCVFRRISNRWVTKCPFHPQDDTPSLNVYPNDTFYCFGCGAWGDALNVVRFQQKGQLR